MDLWRELRRGLRRLTRGSPPPAPDAVLVLRRPGGRLGLAWLVEMDGARLTKLRPGGARRIEVHAGRHRLNLWAGDEGALPMTLTLAPGETAVIEAMTMKRAVRLGLMDEGFAPDPLLLRRVG